MALQTGTPGSGTFNRPPLGSGSAGAPATPPEGSKRGFSGKQLLLAFVGGCFAVGLLTKGNDPDSAAKPTRFAHPVRVTGTGVSVRAEPRPEASAIASVSSTDSVENVGRINDQWSQVRMRDGRTGYVSNQFLEGVSYVPLAAAALAATALARPYANSATTWSTTRRASRLLRQRLGSRRGRSAPSYTATAPAATPSKAPSYTTTYRTTGRSSASSYRPTYAAPRVNYTFSSSSRSSGRSGRRRR